MQDSTSAPRYPHLSEKLDEVRQSFRRFRCIVKQSFRRTDRHTAHIIPSPFRSYSNSPYESDPSEPPLSAAYLEASPLTYPFSSAMDGAGEKRSVGSRSSPVAAIFVHAGAGYHSTTNEHVHLGACKDAAKMAMCILKNGDSAVAAVEAAIRVLEDKEITNAGYGSNLTIDGVVECDATMVDHLGRSGACGATAKVKNPIHLARAILEASSRPLSLRRVPPNLLVGDGATSFAWEHNVNVVPHDALVSKSARERFVKWKDDLRRAGGARLTPETSSSAGSSYADEMVDFEYEERVRNQQRRDHTNAMLNGTWNEGQTDSPQAISPAPIICDDSAEPSYRNSSAKSADVNTGTPPRPSKSLLNILSPLRSVSRNNIAQSSQDSASPAKRARYGATNSSDGQSRTHSLLGRAGMSSEAPKSTPDVEISLGDMHTNYKTHQAEGTDGKTSPTTSDLPSLDPMDSVRSNRVTPRTAQMNVEEDFITDTVGAIAIDIFGNIAAGSSSGGIGMKHRGRVGPAALVGIGTAVIPVDPMDREGITVAAVTSGTGEHMATTMASQKCAERLYFGTRRAPGGQNMAATEEQSMQSFVQDDFMDHPGVKHGNSGGAIGVMAVKRSPYGYFLHFAHNTDSFALASMHSNEREPKCVMSRMGDHASVVQGGRKIRSI